MAAVARVRAQLWPRGLPPDPGLKNLRVATRAALIQPLVLAFGLLVLRNPQMTLYMVFAVFSLLVLTNFGGRRAARLRAYLVTTLVGGVLVAVGSLASPYPAVAALVALIVVFCVEFAGVFSGYVSASRFPLLLGYVLAASVPAPPSAVPEQVLGWLIGGLIASLARVLLWPLFERDALIDSAAKAIGSVAALVATTTARTDPVASEQQQIAQKAVSDFRQIYGQTPFRPAGPTRRDRALARLGTELEQALTFAVPPPSGRQAATNRRLPESTTLALDAVSVLESSARVLKGGPVPDLNSLEHARRAHRTALDAWAGSRLSSGASAESVLDGLDSEHWLRMLSLHCLAIGAVAAIFAGKELDPGSTRILYGAPTAAGLRPAVRRIAQTVRAHLSWTSPLMHTSIRAAVGLALAVLLARLFGLQHAFWVVLGTLSVLRSNALGTGRTAIQALVGTLLGFATGGLFALLFARDPLALWAALPVAIFLAAYAPSAFSFVAGQAAFTVLLLIVFNLISPIGWQVGLVRIEDIAVGTAIGLAAGTLLWPRGARSDFAYNLSRLYRLVAVHLAEGIDLVMGHGQVASVTATRAQVWQAREKTGESFDQLLEEHSSRQLAPDVAASMVAAADHAVGVADSLQVAFELGYVASDCEAGARRLDGAGSALVASWFMLAERIEGIGAVHTVPLDREELRQAALHCLEAWHGESSERGKAAIAVAWTREWVEQLGEVVSGLDEPAGDVARAAAAPWWK